MQMRQCPFAKSKSILAKSRPDVDLIERLQSEKAPERPHSKLQEWQATLSMSCSACEASEVLSREMAANSSLLQVPAGLIVDSVVLLEVGWTATLKRRGQLFSHPTCIIISTHSSWKPLQSFCCAESCMDVARGRASLGQRQDLNLGRPNQFAV